jgi:hypothetical protein
MSHPIDAQSLADRSAMADEKDSMGANRAASPQVIGQGSSHRRGQRQEPFAPLFGLPQP